MKLNCIEIAINDEDLGCQVTFSENKSLGEESANMTTSEIIKSIGRYLLIQRSYPEDEFDSNNYYFETHNENLCGDFTNYQMKLSRTHFELEIKNEKIEVSINPTEKEFNDLKKVLSLLTNKNGKLIVND